MAKTENKNIRQLSFPDLVQYFETLGEKKFRAGQVWEWLWQKGAQSFADMTNLSKDLRQKLGENFSLPALAVDATQYSADGTIKSRFRTFEGHMVEGVLIPTETRVTACVSSQIGCSLNCKFCATGYIEKKRNLDFDEIYDEVVLINQQCERVYGKKLTNIVFMGMGEPLLNYKNVLKAIERITAEDGLATKPNWLRHAERVASLEAGLILSAVLLLAGLAWSVWLVNLWRASGFGPLDPRIAMRSAIPAVTLMVLGMQAAAGALFAGALQAAWAGAHGQRNRAGA